MLKRMTIDLDIPLSLFLRLIEMSCRLRKTSYDHSILALLKGYDHFSLGNANAAAVP